MLLVRTEGADERLAPPVTCGGMVDLVRLEVDFGGPCTMDLEFGAEIAEAHSLITEPLLKGTSLSVQ